jgi:uncharacterized SAM-binding protein YcdF (DUF218 family)
MDAVVACNSGLRGTDISPDAKDRLRVAVQLVRDGAAPRLITTRWTYRGVTTDAGQRATIPRDIDWTIAGDCDSTHDEARAVAALLGKGSRIALVTSPLHIRRAVATFSRAGLTVQGVPSGSALAGLHLLRVPIEVARELVAFMAYRAIGRA